MKHSGTLMLPAWLSRYIDVRHAARRRTSLAFPVPLAGLAGLVAFFVAIPVVYIFLRAAGADLDDWQRLLQARIWKLLGNTLLLVVAVTGGTLLIGVSMAWLTERTDLPGLLAGGALVFLTSLKELPATLLLRPAGFDTLAVRVWVWAADGFYVQAAPAALFLVLASALPLSF